MAEADVKCFFCQGTSKYSCPQCLVRYCSVVCYQSKPHQACSEHFYKQQVSFVKTIGDAEFLW